jgi:hypothetical protein
MVKKAIKIEAAKKENNEKEQQFGRRVGKHAQNAQGTVVFGNRTNSLTEQVDVRKAFDSIFLRADSHSPAKRPNLDLIESGMCSEN